MCTTTLPRISNPPKTAQSKSDPVISFLGFRAADIQRGHATTRADRMPRCACTIPSLQTEFDQCADIASLPTLPSTSLMRAVMASMFVLEGASGMGTRFLLQPELAQRACNLDTGHVRGSRAWKYLPSTWRVKIVQGKPGARRYHVENLAFVPLCWTSF